MCSVTFHLIRSLSGITLLVVSEVLQCVASKLVEMAVLEQISTFMDQHRLWNANNHAYRKSLSTNTAMLQLTYRIFEAPDKNTISTIMVINQLAAFYSISHKILKEKNGNI